MKKVFQTETGKGVGNCMQAAIASLLDLELSEVPNFIKSETWFQDIKDFLNQNGYEFINFIFNPTLNKLLNLGLDCFQEVNWSHDDIMHKDSLQNYTGINGLFYASVLSPKHATIGTMPENGHAVVIDKDFNIVHDPNKNYEDIKRYPLSDILGFNGVTDVYVINKIK